MQRTQLNAWGVMHVLHTFTGAPAADSRNRRDWTLTTVWALSMDAVAAGLIVMVLGSYVMWFRLRAKRLGGIVALRLASSAVERSSVRCGGCSDAACGWAARRRPPLKLQEPADHCSACECAASGDRFTALGRTFSGVQITPETERSRK